MSALVETFNQQAGARRPVRPERRVVVVPPPRRPVDLRRPPRRPRPVVAPLRREPVPCASAAATPSWLYTAAIGLAVTTAIVVFGLIAGSSGVGAPVPDATKVIYVQSGQSLWSIAESSAPDSAPDAVVHRIDLLNGLGGAPVHPGQALRVPVEQH